MLLGGVGFGVGVAALVVGHRGAVQPANSLAHPHAGRAASAARNPASAGTQPSRAAAQADGEAAGRAQLRPGAGADVAPVLDGDASASFARLAAGLPGRVELTVAPLGAGSPETLGGGAPAHGWSTTKVPVLTALLKASEESLTPEEQYKRFLEAAKEHGVEEKLPEIERSFGGLARRHGKNVKTKKESR